MGNWIWLIFVPHLAALVTCLVCRSHAVLLRLAAITVVLAVAAVPVVGGLACRQVFGHDTAPQDVPQDWRMGMAVLDARGVESVLMTGLVLVLAFLILSVPGILLTGGLIRRGAARRSRGPRRSRDASIDRRHH